MAARVLCSLRDTLMLTLLTIVWPCWANAGFFVDQLPDDILPAAAGGGWLVHRLLGGLRYVRVCLRWLLLCNTALPSLCHCMRVMVFVCACACVEAADTFVVRTILVPCIMLLLGRHNWWPRRFATRVDTSKAEGLYADVDRMY